MKYIGGKKLLIIILLIISVPIGFVIYKEVVTPKIIRREQQTFEAVTTGVVIPDQVYAVSNEFVNFYLLENNGEYIAIDAGYDVEQSKIEMQKLGIQPDQVKYLLLTHSDVDHIAMAELFSQANIYLPEEEVQMINGGVKRNLFSRNSFQLVFKTINDKEIIDLLGYSIKGIHTPGHTKGSMSYLINEKWLFVGDTLSIIDGKVQIFNSYFNMDDKEQEKSIEKLSKIEGIEYIFTGHYGFHSDPSTLFLK